MPELSAALARETNRKVASLEPISVACAWPVFKATFADGDAAFVKVTDRVSASRTLQFLKQIGDCPFLPRPVVDHSILYGENCVLALGFLASTRVNAENMTDLQYESFRENYRKLEALLQRFPRADVQRESSDEPQALRTVIADYARRFPFLRGALKSLLAADCSYEGRTLAVIHGDFQPANYGFTGDRFAAVYDTDNLALGLPCEDAAYAFTERARRQELSADARARLTTLFLRLVEDCPWPRADWIVAVNHARLRIAARRVLKHPHSPFVVFDVLRRDRALRPLVEALEARHA